MRIMMEVCHALSLLVLLSCVFDDEVCLFMLHAYSIIDALFILSLQQVHANT